MEGADDAHAAEILACAAQQAVQPGLRAAGERVVFLLRTLKRLLKRFAGLFGLAQAGLGLRELVCCLGGRGVGLVELGLQLCGLGAGGVQILLQQRDVLSRARVGRLHLALHVNDLDEQGDRHEQEGRGEHDGHVFEHGALFLCGQRLLRCFFCRFLRLLQFRHSGVSSVFPRARRASYRRCRSSCP